MKVIHYRDILPIAMHNEQIKDVTGRLMIGKADGAENFCMRLFEIGPGGHTPLHTHDWEHEVFIHQGRGEVRIKNRSYPLTGGTAVFIPAGVEHQFRNTSDQPFFFVCLIPSGAPEI